MTAVRSYGCAIQLHTAGMEVPTANSSTGEINLRSFTNLTMNTAAQSLAMLGAITWDDEGNHTFGTAGSKIHWYEGATTWANVGSALTFSVQGVTTASPAAPNNTPIASKTFVGNANAITANAINTAVMDTGAGATISHGQWVSVVFALTTVAGGDSVQPNMYNGAGAAGNTTPYCMTSTNAGVAWSMANRYGNILLESDDGHFGWMCGLFLPNLTATLGWNSGSATKEYGSEIKLPWPVTLQAVSLPLRIGANTSDFELCVYSTPTGTATLMATATTFSAKRCQGTADYFSYVVLDTPIALAAATVYAITVRPTTTNSVTFRWITFGASNNGKMASLPMGINTIQVSRAGTGTSAFTEDNTILVPMILHISKFDDGAGGGGGTTRGIIYGS